MHVVTRICTEREREKKKLNLFSYFLKYLLFHLTNQNKPQRKN
jgi:hypothetical protein